jgi:hypothetical protein
MTPGSSSTPLKAVQVVIRGVIRQFTCVFEGSIHSDLSRHSKKAGSSVALTRKVHVVTMGSTGRWIGSTGSDSTKVDIVNQGSTTMTRGSSHACYKKVQVDVEDSSILCFLLRRKYVILIAMFWAPNTSIASCKTFYGIIWVLLHQLVYIATN